MTRGSSVTVSDWNSTSRDAGRTEDSASRNDGSRDRTISRARSAAGRSFIAKASFIHNLPMRVRVSPSGDGPARTPSPGAKEPHMIRSIHTVILAIAASTMLGLPAACKASDVTYDFVGQVPVELKGLNLHDPDAARILLARLDRAAWQACGGDPKFHSAYAMRPEQVRRVFQECRNDAVARAVK